MTYSGECCSACSPLTCSRKTGRQLHFRGRINDVILAKTESEDSMPDDLRITVAELKKRMEAGEDFTIIDTRNPQAWAETLEIVPEAIRVPLYNLDESISRIPKDKPIVAYCT